MLARATALCLLLAFAGGIAHARGHAFAVGPGLAPERALTQYVLDVWTVQDGLPQNSVVSIEQTSDGFLWLGTQEGLVRFDGLHFTTYTQEVPNPFVSALHEDADGTLWIGTYGGGLTRYADGEFTTHAVEGLPDGHISALASAPGGALWIGTFDGGLARLQDGALELFSTAAGAPESGITALATDAGGTVWIGTLEEGVVRFRDGQFTPFTVEDGLSAAEVRSLYPAADGSLWVATRLGVDRIAGGRVHHTPAPGLAEDAPRSIFSDAKGNLWIGTQQQGLIRLRDGRLEQLTTEGGLPHDAVTKIYEDREGSLWLGTDGGLARLHSGRLTSYSTPEGLPHSVVFSVYEDADGAIWMGTEGGGLARLQGEHVTTYTTEDGLSGDVVLAVRGTQDGSIWAGTHQAGLARLHDGKISTYTVEDGLPAESVFALYEDQAGTLWLGTSNGLGRFRDGAFSTLTTADGLSNDLVTVMTEDADGRLWVGTYEGGLNVLDGDDVVAHVSTDEGLPSELILSLRASSDGALWAGTQNGLSRITEREGGFDVHTFTAVHGLPSGTVLELFEDASGWLWMSSNRGLFRVHTDDFAAVAAGARSTLSPTLYGRSDGLRSEEFNGGVQPAGWQGSDGTLWFPTTDGVIAVDPAHLPGYPIASARIQGVFTDGDLVALDADASEADAELTPEQRRLTFRYAAPSFLAPERIRYRYRLDGVDDHWIEAGPRREAFYTNLAPGPYTFHVQALNADGVSGPVASLPLRITPYFYETTWFKVLCVLAGLILLGLAYVTRFRILEARQRELEELVEARTEDLRQTNDQLAETSEMKSQLMHVVAHNLKNPLSGVHGLARVLEEELPPASTHQELAHLIEDAAKDMMTMVIRFLDVEAIDNKGDVLLSVEPLDVRSLAREAVERFRGQAKRKDQRLTLAPLPSEPSFILGDPTWLEEVMDNLVSNAVKYTPLGKGMEVRIEHREDDEGSFVRIAVEDEGPGLTEEDQEKLFGRFRRLSAKPTGNEASTGLGLSIVKGIVDRHGGRVWAETTLGVGTTFFIEFEAIDAPETAPPAILPEELAAEATGIPAQVVPVASDELDDDDWMTAGAFILDSGFYEPPTQATTTPFPPVEDADASAADEDEWMAAGGFILDSGFAEPPVPPPPEEEAADPPDTIPEAGILYID